MNRVYDRNACHAKNAKTYITPPALRTLAPFCVNLLKIISFQKKNVPYDIVIVGGGIVGLATALQIQKKKPALKLLLIEKETELAKHQTGNNSGVIHSGIYYKPGSLKATNCIQGYRLLVEFCRQYEIPFELCGKIIVASNEAELPLLQNLFARGQQNGLQNLKQLTREELKEHEPHVKGIGRNFCAANGDCRLQECSQEVRRIDSAIRGRTSFR